MEEASIDGGMIEIGDPNEESTAAVPPPKVIIEYRERGVPWMLIPPLLIIAAVGAVLGYHKLARMVGKPQPTLLARAPEVPPPLDRVEIPIPAVETPARPAEVQPKPAEQPIVPTASIEPSATALPPANPVPPADSPTFPRVQSLGFDPKALEAERKPDAPADSALAPAGKPSLPDEPDKVPPQEERPLPKEVPEEILPPDPALARERKKLRVVEALRAVDADRVRFHQELRDICQEWREKSGPEISRLNQRYETRVEPSSAKKAKFLLGPVGPYAGVDKATRINILRDLGYPEPAILDDLFMWFEKKKVGERGGPRTLAEAEYFAARSLLRYPPSPPGPLSRPIPRNTNGTNTRPSPTR